MRSKNENTSLCDPSGSARNTRLRGPGSSALSPLSPLPQREARRVAGVFGEGVLVRERGRGLEFGR